MKGETILNKSGRNLAILVLPWMLFGIVLLLFLDVNAMSVLTMVVFFALCIVCFADLSTNIFFACFLLSFFVFLISGDLAEQIFHRQYWLQFGKSANEHSRICILISLVFMLFGFILTKSSGNLRFTLGVKKERGKEHIESIKKASKWVFYLTYWILLFDTFSKVLFVAVNGYVAYYTDYSSPLPMIIVKIGDFSLIAFAVFLATFPSKKECRMPMVLYMLYSAAQFLMGQRGGLVYNFVFVFGYLYYRNDHDNGGKIWIHKFTVGGLIVCMPIVLVFLQLYGYIRSGVEIEFDSFVDSLVDFFVNIGSSSKVIKAGYVYQDSIPGGKFYSLGSVLNYFKYSPLFNFFSQDKISVSHTAAYALEGHSFGEMISYYYMRSYYFAGEGSGSSFIAELYADLRYVGIAIGSYVYGIIFKKISYLDSNNWLATAVNLLMFMYTIKAPRGEYDGFLACIINLKHMAVILLILIMAETLYYVKLSKRSGDFFMKRVED